MCQEERPPVAVFPSLRVGPGGKELGTVEQTACPFARRFGWQISAKQAAHRGVGPTHGSGKKGKFLRDWAPCMGEGCDFRDMFGWDSAPGSNSWMSAKETKELLRVADWL